jgi:DNA-binding MarR family transcriptional regulator
VARTKEALAADVWNRIFTLFMATRPQRDLVLKRFGLTPNDARALYSLDEDHPRTMRSLADEWGCDASNATWMVDRLERQGLAERRPLASDRRVKHVVLTPAGGKTKTELYAGMVAAPPELLQLDRAELEALAAVIDKIRFDPGYAMSSQPKEHGSAAERPA